MLEADSSPRFEVLRQLRKAGYPVARVVRVDSPGDSGTPYIEVLFVTSDNRPHRAYLAKKAGKTLVWTREGWGLPTAFEAPPA